MAKRYFNSIIEMATAIYEDRDVYTSSGIKLTYNPKLSNPWMYDGTDYMHSIWGEWGKCYEEIPAEVQGSEYVLDCQCNKCELYFNEYDIDDDLCLNCRKK